VKKMRIGLALAAAVLVVNLVEAGAGAQVQRRAGGACGVAPCYSAFTVNGNAPPAGVSLTLTSASGQIQVSISKSGSTELSPAITTNDTIHMVLDLGTFDPVVFGTTGLISSYSETTGGTNTVTLDMKPSASSWNMSGCSIVNCGSDINPVTATNDFTSVAIGFVSDLSTSGATQTVKDAMRGTWFSTNAQSMALPSFNAATGAVSFTVAAPHFKTDGSTLNTGFFEFFAPDPLVQSMGVADPTTVTGGTFTVTSSNNSSTTFSVVHQPSPAGVLIQAGTNPPTLPTFSYSSPTFTVAKAATVPGAPTSVSATRGDGQASVSFAAPSSDGGAAISSYTVTASPGGATASGSGSPITVSGLTNGTSYTFTVTATNSVGTSSPSSASGAVTPAGLPGAPTAVTASAGDGQAAVSFTAPAANGAAISSYTVTASPGGATASGSGSPITVSGLTNCTSYTFTVTATNSVGTGAASPASPSVTPAAAAGCSPATPQPAPPVPTSGSLSLQAPPGGQAPTIVWTGDTFASVSNVTGVTEAVTPSETPPALSGFAVGSVAVEVNVTSGGTAVHAFAAPLEIVFPGAASGLAPGYSDDGGVTWIAIPHLPGTALPAGQTDGYYVDGAGAVHILTLHATYFGLLGNLVLRTWNRASFPVGSPRIFVYLAPERKAAATVTLETHAGVVLNTLQLTLPARSTRMKIPLPPGSKAGIYLVKVAATSGAASVQRILVVRLSGHK